jgi:hypothetical protein
MENQSKNSSENFFQDLKDVGIKHFNNKLEWTKLVAVEKASKVIAALASFFILGVIGFFLMAYASLMLGFFFTSILGSTLYGFGLVTLILFLVFFVVNYNKEKWIKIPVMNLIIQILLESDEESQDI